MKKCIFIFLNEKTEFIPSSEVKCPKSGIFTIIIWWCESGKAILQVSIAVFFRALPKYFSGKDGSAPLEKNGPYAYEFTATAELLVNFTDL